MQFPDRVDFKMMSKIFLVLPIVMRIIEASPVCNTNWEDASSEGLGYLWYKNTTMTYSEAVTFCSDQQAQLVEIDTVEQLSFLRSKLTDFSVNVEPISFGYEDIKPFWGGATKEGGNEWRWTNSRVKVQDFVWGEGEPNYLQGREDKLCFLLIWMTTREMMFPVI